MEVTTLAACCEPVLDAGLLRREQRGRWVYLRVVPARLDVLRDALASDGATRA